MVVARPWSPVVATSIATTASGLVRVLPIVVSLWVAPVSVAGRLWWGFVVVVSVVAASMAFDHLFLPIEFIISQSYVVLDLPLDVSPLLVDSLPSDLIDLVVDGIQLLLQLALLLLRLLQLLLNEEAFELHVDLLVHKEVPGLRGQLVVKIMAAHVFSDDVFEAQLLVDLLLDFDVFYQAAAVLVFDLLHANLNS